MEFAYHDLLKTPLSGDQIVGITRLAGVRPEALVNTRSQAFKKLGVTLSELSQEDLLRMMADNPRVMIRPMLSDGQRVLLGFHETKYAEFVSRGESGGRKA